MLDKPKGFEKPTTPGAKPLMKRSHIRCLNISINLFKYEGDAMDFLKEIWLYMRERKKFWLAPIILILLLFGLLIVVGGGSAVAPFIYTLF